ncbi:BA75_01209T0 [Komagataella pastoris]|uniref:BA75_01209T0 n=1 Tax=Komagataella pastoris TaxID=4922 RepID=A0A1B2J8K8_PICPA|nr:BA75_01209T0 [Komagataella pastoris]
MKHLAVHKYKIGAIAAGLVVSYKIFAYRAASSSSSNVINLTNMAKTPITLKPPQAPLRWDHTPEQILAETDKYISTSQEVDDWVANSFATADVDTIKKIAASENEQYLPLCQLSFYQHISDNKDVRNASTVSEEKIDKFSIESNLREDVFKTVNKVFKQVQEDSELQKTLDPEFKRLLEKLNLGYVRSGLDLSQEKRDEVKRLKQELSTISIKFNKNLGEETEHIWFTDEELKGVPESVVEQFETKTENDVTYHKMTYKYPDLFPVLKYAVSSATRQRAFVGDQNKIPENAGLLVKAVNLRNQLAEVLGYDTYADYILEVKMAKNSKNVFEFLDDVREKLRPLGEKELQRMLALKANDPNADDKENYYVWDHRYYDNKLLESEYKVDEQKLAEYFPMESTIEKMLAIYEHLFNLQFEQVDESDKQVWHPDVKQFSVWKVDNPDSPEFVGWIYFDLHPREGKYGHAANFGIGPSYIKEDGSKNYPVTALVCNFSKPSKDKPSLLKHNEVTTFFHELGHGIHDLIGQTRYARFHGTSVARDFVECPSQILEYWTWTRDQLKSLSQHYKTGESLPDDLIDSLVKSKHVNGAIFNLRQLHFGLFDMKLHTAKEPESLDVTKLWNELREEVALVKNGDQITKGYGSFGHLMGGYAAGYYGYLYSQVFASDIYYTFFKADPMSTAQGIKYRDIILARGGSREELDNLKELLGREPTSDAFMTELGVENGASKL